MRFSAFAPLIEISKRHCHQRGNSRERSDRLDEMVHESHPAMGHILARIA
jgi:hypothetical protein